MDKVVILTGIFIIGALVGVFFIENRGFLRTFLFMLGGVIWYMLTYQWWAEKILDKFFQR